MTRHRSARLPRALRWGLLLAVLLATVVLFSGCFGGAAPTLTAFPPAQRDTVAAEMTAIETEIHAFETRLKASQVSLPEGVAVSYSPDEALRAKLGFGEEELAKADPAISGRAFFLRGYYLEYQQKYPEAYADYLAAQKLASPYGAQAYYRAGVLAWRSALSVKVLPGFTGADALFTNGVLVGKNVQDAHNLARTNLRALSTQHDNPSVLDQLFKQAKPQQFRVLERTVPGAQMPDGLPIPTLAGEGGLLGAADGPVIVPQVMAKTALSDLDQMYRFGSATDRIYYAVVQGLVLFFNRLSPAWGSVLALIFLALFVKVITIPFTNAAFRGMRDMQRIQPLLKELQEKYKDDKQRFAEEQMRVMKEHNVNPMGGCLPMLIQLPIFIIVYNAVNVYAYGFWNASFLWIPSLALPDFVLLVLYLASMVVSQKLSPTASTADPAMKQQQAMMTWLMPIMLVMFLKDFASAFVLYWLFLNIFTTLHQMYLLRLYAREDAAAGISPAGSTRNAKPSDSDSNTRKKGK